MESPEPPRVNVADRLAAVAAERPDAIALVACDGRSLHNGWRARRTMKAGADPSFSEISFGHLDRDADTLARGLAAMGIGPGKRIALLVKPGIEFVTLVFALLRTGATMVLVDAGLGRKNIVRCLAATEPDGFVAIPLGHAMRVVKRKHFPKAKLNVTVGRQWFWGGETLESLRKLGAKESPSPTGGGARGGGKVSPGDNSSCTTERTKPDGQNERDSAGDPQPSPNPSLQGRGMTDALPLTVADDPAAIAFTSGSTGPPKGVLYTHQTFVTQCDEIQREYDIRPGDTDLACFPLFGLFNVACGVTTVLPEMDFSRPASCDPKKLLAAANQWKVNQAFASPAVWDRVSRHCEQTGDTIPTLKKVLSCGAPVPAKVLRRTLACVHPEATMHTPYGATESLPVATIEAQELLNETAAKTDQGAGVCVGKKFDTIDWRIIRITDDPIETLDQTEELPQGEIGELIVRGPQVSKHYLTTRPADPNEPRPSGSDHNAQSKIKDGATIWHRIGDVGYFDEQARFWYCGRKSQRVVTESGTLYTECVEQVFNAESKSTASALVGVKVNGTTEAIVVFDETSIKPTSGLLSWDEERDWLTDQHEQLEHLWDILPSGPLPTDIRHNSKIQREKLAVWAEKQLKKKGTLIDANQH